jgi:hypothetical protein
LVVPKSTTQSATGMGVVGIVELRQPARDCGSHSLNHGIEGDDCCDRGDGNKGTTYCIEKPYWGTVKKACTIDQYGAPPMHGLNEDGQAGCTKKPY